MTQLNGAIEGDVTSCLCRGRRRPTAHPYRDHAGRRSLINGVGRFTPTDMARHHCAKGTGSIMRDLSEASCTLPDWSGRMSVPVLTVQPNLMTRRRR